MAQRRLDQIGPVQEVGGPAGAGSSLLSFLKKWKSQVQRRKKASKMKRKKRDINIPLVLLDLSSI